MKEQTDIKPLISVLMPCYNAEKYIEIALKSILNQTYINLEIIAINDCSKDSTLEILQKYSIEDTRIIVINNEVNLGIVKTLNKGIDFCNGEFIARMDSDDIALPTRLEKQLEFLLQNSSIDIVGCQFKTFTDKHPNKLSPHTNPIHDNQLRAYMLFKSGVCHPSAMIRKRVFTELGLHFELEYLHVEDYAFWTKALYLTKIANLGDYLLHYRVHESQISSLNNTLQLENKKKIYTIHMNHLGIAVNQENLSIHASIAECVPEVLKSLLFLRKCEAYMLNIIKINETKEFCNHDFLLQIMAIHWLRLCANSTLGLRTLKIVKSSDLFNKKHYNKKDILILLFKSIFLIKYKKSKVYKIFF